jgi:hypothetical protein
MEAKAKKYQAREVDDAKPSFLQALHSSLGVPELAKQSSKQRGMSDVDTSNIAALKNNTSSMINLSLSRIKSTHSRVADGSPTKQDERKEPEDSDDEFFDALDDEKDLQMVDALLKEKEP